MNRSENLKTAASYLPVNIRLAIGKVDAADITELRLKAGRPVTLIRNGVPWYLCRNGLVRICTEECYRVSPEDISAIAEKICRYSIHACTEQLAEGCFVIENGIRVGAAGRFSQGQRQLLTDFYSLNFRLPMQVKGCAGDIFDQIYPRRESVLICGKVCSGKTTFLRDLARSLGNVCKTAVIDERNEIFASSGGLPTFDPGLNTDIFTDTSRSHGITLAMRVMSPDYVICDEIATDADVSAIISAHGSGIRFAATIHADNFESLQVRPTARKLIQEGVFQTAVILADRKIREIRRIGDV